MLTVPLNCGVVLLSVDACDADVVVVVVDVVEVGGLDDEATT